MKYNPIPVSIKHYIITALSKIPIDTLKTIPRKYQEIILDKKELDKLISKGDLYKIFDLFNQCNINWGIYFITEKFDIDSAKGLIDDDIVLSTKRLGNYLKESSSFIASGKIFSLLSGVMTMASEMNSINDAIKFESMNILQNSNSISSHVLNRNFEEGFSTMIGIFENYNTLNKVCDKYGVRFSELVTLCFFAKNPYQTFTRQEVMNNYNPGYGKCVSRLHKISYIDNISGTRYMISNLGIVTLCNIIGEFMVYVLSNKK